MVGHGGSSAGSYLADPTSPIPSHCASVVATSTLRVNYLNSWNHHFSVLSLNCFASLLLWTVIALLMVMSFVFHDSSKANNNIAF